MRDDNLLINTAVWGNKKDDVNMNGLANWAMSAREGLGFIVRALFFDTAHKSQHNGDKRRGLTGENLCAKVKKMKLKKNNGEYNKLKSEVFLRERIPQCIPGPADR